MNEAEHLKEMATLTMRQNEEALQREPHLCSKDLLEDLHPQVQQLEEMVDTLMGNDVLRIAKATLAYNTATTGLIRHHRPRKVQRKFTRNLDAAKWCRNARRDLGKAIDADHPQTLPDEAETQALKAKLESRSMTPPGARRCPRKPSVMATRWPSSGRLM